MPFDPRKLLAFQEIGSISWTFSSYVKKKTLEMSERISLVVSTVGDLRQKGD